MFIFFLSILTYAQIKVAVIDSGLDAGVAADIPLCSTDHMWDKTDTWSNKHGTNVSGLINRYTKKSHYCQIILQVFNEKNNINVIHKIQKALRTAIDTKVDVINLSLGGINPLKKEKELIKEALDKNIVVVVASGNSGDYLSKSHCNYYPACYDDRLIVVTGSSNNANTGPIVDFFELSVNLTAYGITLSGTSQAAAVRTGKIIRKMSNVSK
jgi:subtilisin family serine protease